MVVDYGLDRIVPLLTGMLFLAFFVGVALLYVYSSYTLMRIAQKSKTKFAWLAWIPIINLYLFPKIGRVSILSLLFLLFFGLPIVGGPLMIILFGWWGWFIAQRRNAPRWIGLFLGVPGINLIVLGYLAWKK